MGTDDIIIAILLCIGAVQGLVFGAILMRSATTANRLLAVILFFLSYRLTVQVMRLFGLGYYDGWYYLMLDLSWVNGALLYFYARAQVIPDFKIRGRDWWHFFPLALQIVCSIFVRLQNLYWDGTRESLSWLGYWGYVVWMNNSTIYLVASGLIVGYAILAQRSLENPPAGVLVDSTRLAWIKRIIAVFKWYFAAVLVILLLDFLVFRLFDGGSYFYFIRFYYYPFFIGLSGLTYWIGMEGFRRKDQPGPQWAPALSPSERQQLQQIADDMDVLMREQKPFTQADLSLRSLAEQLGVKPYLLSKCFKEILGTKYSDYINDQRLAEVQRLLRQPESQQFTLLSLALDAGFYSKSSFHRVVKKRLGISPRELKEQS